MVTVSSPLSTFFYYLLATQVPQAAGSGYAYRVNN